jgi:hypothetical protein
MKNQTQKNKKLIREAAKSLGIFIFIATLALYLAVPVFAADLNEVISGIGQKTSLPGYDTAGHSNASYESGANSITSALLYGADLLKYGLATVAVVMIIFIGVKLITAGKKIDDVSPKMKEALKYVIIGFVVVMVADPLVRQVFFGESGEVFRSEADAQLAAQRGTEQAKGIYNMFEYFTGAVAVLMIVYAGIKMVASQGNEDAIGKSKKQIMWACVGIALIGLSEFIVKDIVFPKEGSQIVDVNAGRRMIVNITNFASGFIAAVAIAFYMVAGVTYVTALGKEDKVGKAKKMIFGATIGLLVAMAAYALVNTLVTFEVRPDELGGSAASESLPTNP